MVKHIKSILAGASLAGFVCVIVAQVPAVMNLEIIT